MKNVSIFPSLRAAKGMPVIDVPAFKPDGSPEMVIPKGLTGWKVGDMIVFAINRKNAWRKVFRIYRGLPVPLAILPPTHKQ
jgi:hypothetical protein